MYIRGFLASPEPAVFMRGGSGKEGCNHAYLGSYCSTHVVCNLPDPQRME